MSKLLVALGWAFVVLGVSLAVSPEWFLTSVDWDSRQGLYIAAGIRVVSGLVLLLAASTSRFPRLLRALGALTLVAGLLLPFLPIELWGHLTGLWMLDNVLLFRTVVAIGAVLVGGFLVYAARPVRLEA